MKPEEIERLRICRDMVVNGVPVATILAHIDELEDAINTCYASHSIKGGPEVEPGQKVLTLGLWLDHANEKIEQQAARIAELEGRTRYLESVKDGYRGEAFRRSALLREALPWLGNLVVLMTEVLPLLGKHDERGEEWARDYHAGKIAELRALTTRIEAEVKSEPQAEKCANCGCEEFRAEKKPDPHSAQAMNEYFRRHSEK